MGSIILRRFLQSLCFNTHWNYAVFWKLRHENQLLLTWEDGCCNHAKLQGSMGSTLDDGMCFNGSNEIFSYSLGSSRHDGHSGKYSIGQAVADMAGVQYQWGEGIIGEVAYTGNHCWVLRENIFKSKVIPACPDEWLLQFAAGIQTIVLVPAVPHGVLQLGTVEKVAEDVALVAYIRDKLFAYQNGDDLLPFTNMEFLAQTTVMTSSLMPTIMDNLDEPSASFVNQMKSEDPKAVCGVKPTNKKLSSTNQITPVCLVQDPCHISGKDMLDILNCTRENEISFQSTVFEGSKPLNQPFNDTKSEMMEGVMAGYSSLEEELQDFSFSDNCDVGIFGEHANVTTGRDMVEHPFVDKDADNWDCKNISTFFCFPMDCELHKALGSAFLGQTKQYLWDSSVASEDACNRSSPTFNTDIIQNIDQSTCGSSGYFDERDDVEHLLEAVVAGVNGGSNDNFFKEPNGVKSSVTSLEQFAASTEGRSRSEESEYVDEGSVPWSSLTTAFGARGQIAVSKSPQASSFESMMSTLIGDQQQKNGFGYQQTRKGSKLPNARKRSARPGSQRPRPRDRQLIQDRLKELRQLVPNGSTCSIDGLLEKTINHMLFLRSATDQADKLRQWVDQEVTRWKNMKSSDTKFDQKNGGASWAFELGSDLQVCPIVVEDLECPGHMLIKMLCNDHGLFLEIAEVIRRLGLSILKGVRESCADNTWAHFIVEVSRGFHRLDIFWPLMQLLQQNQSPISSKV